MQRARIFPLSISIQTRLVGSWISSKCLNSWALYLQVSLIRRQKRFNLRDVVSRPQNCLLFSHSFDRFETSEDEGPIHIALIQIVIYLPLATHIWNTGIRPSIPREKECIEFLRNRALFLRQISWPSFFLGLHVAQITSSC